MHVLDDLSQHNTDTSNRNLAILCTSSFCKIANLGGLAYCIQVRLLMQLGHRIRHIPRWIDFVFLQITPQLLPIDVDVL